MAGEPLKILRRHSFAQPGEPDEIGEGDRHVSRAGKQGARLPL